MQDTPPTVAVTARFTAEDLDRIADWAYARRLARSAAITSLVRVGLDAAEVAS